MKKTQKHRAEHVNLKLLEFALALRCDSSSGAQPKFIHHTTAQLLDG